jgi:hypothetical protein
MKTVTAVYAAGGYGVAPRRERRAQPLSINKAIKINNEKIDYILICVIIYANSKQCVAQALSAPPPGGFRA